MAGTTTDPIPLPDLERGAEPVQFRADSGREDDGDAAATSSSAGVGSSGGSGGGGWFGSGSGSMDIESGEFGGLVKVNVGKSERDCRICHLGLGSNGDQPIELGCSCKGDLAAAHLNCAEDWFKIRGNRTCEICHSEARNIAAPDESEPTLNHQIDPDSAMAISAGSTLASANDHRTFWHGHRFLNFLLACMVVAFVVSWLCHFRVPSRH